MFSVTGSSFFLLLFDELYFVLYLGKGRSSVTY